MKKRTKIVGFVTLFTLVGGGIVIYAQINAPIPQYTAVSVVSTTFVQSVEETGVIDTQVSITYGWETSGRVIEVSHEVGDIVTSSDIIARLDNRSEVNQLRQAQSQLAAATARLNEALADATVEDKAIYAARIAGAKASLAQAESELQQVRTTVAATIADAERTVAKAQTALQQTDSVSQAVEDAYDDLINTLQTLLPTLRNARIESDNILGIDNEFANDEYEDIIGVKDLSTLSRATTQYAKVRTAIPELEESIQTLLVTAPMTRVDSIGNTADIVINETNLLLQYVQAVLEATPAIGALSQTELGTLKSLILAEKSNIANARVSLTNATQAVTTAKNSTQSNEISLQDALAALETANRIGDQQIAAAERVVEARRSTVLEAEAQYNALVAAPRAVDVAALRADVSRYVAAVEAAQTAVDDMVLRALADGTITMIDAKVGQTVTPNQDIVTIQSNDRKIEVDISESDIAKVAVGDSAFVELDAYSDALLNARVTRIDPAATEISGVVYYQTTLEVDVPENLDVRPGMTADVQIITEEKNNVFALPRRAVLTRENGSRYVRILTDAQRAKYEERTVQVGISGDDGLVEIISGLVGGEEVITFIEE